MRIHKHFTFSTNLLYMIAYGNKKCVKEIFEKAYIAASGAEKLVSRMYRLRFVSIFYYSFFRLSFLLVLFMIMLTFRVSPYFLYMPTLYFSLPFLCQRMLLSLCRVYLPLRCTIPNLLIRTMVRWHPFYVCFVIVISVTSSVCFSTSLYPTLFFRFFVRCRRQMGSNEITTMFITLFWRCFCEQSQLAFWEYVLNIFDWAHL